MTQEQELEKLLAHKEKLLNDMKDAQFYARYRDLHDSLRQTNDRIEILRAKLKENEDV